MQLTQYKDNKSKRHRASGIDIHEDSYCEI